jgi:KDO2-lipid IV(A) lauroyltransferase
VVSNNIQKSFPEKSKQEVNDLEKKFYIHLCDLFVEFIKTATISKKEAIKRCKISSASLQLLDQLYVQNKNLILVMGHYGNWEWGGLSFSLQIKYKLFFIYKPLSNPFFDGFMLKVRSRFGAKLIPMQTAFKEMVKYKEVLNATAFIADQTPPPETAHWTTFLNQDTPVFTGTEKISRKLNYPVVFLNIKKIKRGYYELMADLLIEEPANTKEGEISYSHTQRLEREIIKQPEFWLWSHRRWKYKRN